MSKDIQKDICMVWNIFDAFMFSATYFSKKHWVYKFAQGNNVKSSLIKTTQFFNIYKVTNNDMDTPIGFIFSVSGDVATSLTTNALVARFEEANYEFIKNSGRTEMWSSGNGLKLINYDNVSETITDLGDILGVILVK